MKKIEISLLVIILVGAFAVRLYRFDKPIADWHSWRQSDTSAVSRNFIKFGFDILHPRFDDLSNGVSLIDNPQGYRFVEFPIYNVFQAGLFKLVGHFTIEEWGRLVSIISSLFAIVFLYLIVKRYTSIRTAIFTAFFYAFIPYNIYYHRTVLPDPFMIATLFGGLYFFDNYLIETKINKKFLYYSLAIIFTASSFLIKPFIIFFMPAFLYLVFTKYGLGGLKRKDILLFFVLAILPFALWRIWIRQYPQGIPRNDWLYNGNGIRFKGAWFWWIFADRIARLILGFWGLPLFLFGLLIKVGSKEKWLFFTFIMSSLLYVAIFATGNVQHDYYQILIVPTLVIFAAKGADGILKLGESTFNYLISRIIVFACVIFMIFFGWYVVRDFYSIQHPEIIEAGQAVDKMTKKDAKVIAVYGGDTTFLYQTNRQGWPVFERSFKAFRKAGATHIAFVNPSKDDLGFSKLFKTIELKKSYAIFDLTSPLPSAIEAVEKLK